MYVFNRRGMQREDGRVGAEGEVSVLSPSEVVNKKLSSARSTSREF